MVVGAPYPNSFALALGSLVVSTVTISQVLVQKNLDRGRPQPKQNMLIILLVHKKSGAISWNIVELAACVSGVEHLSSL